MKIFYGKEEQGYFFDIIDDSKKVFSSKTRGFLVPGFSNYYKYAWEACRDAYDFVDNRRHHIVSNRRDESVPIPTDVSAEQMIVSHYERIYESVMDSVSGIEDEAQKEKVYQVIKILKKELEKLIEMLKDKDEIKCIKNIYRRLLKTEKKYFSDYMRKDKEEIVSGVKNNRSYVFGGVKNKNNTIDDCAVKVCSAIEKKHPDCYYVVSGNDVLVKDMNNDNLLRVGVNERNNIFSIKPCGYIANMYPFHSLAFYQRYWKPIVESTGTFSLKKEGAIVSSKTSVLPDAPLRNKRHQVEAWNVDCNKEIPIVFDFRDGKWIIKSCNIEKTASFDFDDKKPEDYKDAIIKCKDPSLESIYNRSGLVIQVFSVHDYLEMDVDFGRGIGIVRLTDSQVEIIAQ